MDSGRALHAHLTQEGGLPCAFSPGDDGAVAALDNVGDEPVVVGFGFGEELDEVGIEVVVLFGQFLGGDHRPMSLGALGEVGYSGV